MDSSSINVGQVIGLSTAATVSGDAAIDASARANQAAFASSNGNSNASATGPGTLVTGSSGSIEIGGDASSLRLTALLDANSTAESINGSATSRNGSQNSDFSVESGSPPPARSIGMGDTSPLQLLISGNLTNGGTISGRSMLSTRAASVQGEATADTAIQSLGSNNNELRVSGSIGAGTMGSGLLIEAMSSASTSASSVNPGTFSGATPNNVSATTFLQNAALLNSRLELSGPGIIRLQSTINANNSASAVSSGPGGIDIDPGSNPAAPDFNGTTNARNAAGTVSLSSLASVALAPYDTGVSESPVALPPQTNFTPIPATFPANISLPPNDINTGFSTVVSTNQNFQSSNATDITGIGDFNGDGVDDFALTSSFGDILVLLGQNGNFGANINLSNLSSPTQTFGLTITGAGSQKRVFAAGDIDGDGLSDLLISGADTWLIYGRPQINNIPITLNNTGDNFGTPDAGQGFEIRTVAAPANSPGIFSAGIGDIDNDGKGDILLSSSSGTFIVYGPSNKNQTVVQVSTSTPAPNSFLQISGVFPDSGILVGDLNGNNTADIAIGDKDTQSTFVIDTSDIVRGSTQLISLNSNPTGGAAAVSTSNGSGLTASNTGFVIKGSSNDLSGSALASGDVNGDSLTDLAIAAPGTPGGGSVSVVYGRSNSSPSFPSVLTTSQIQSPFGFTLTGPTSSTSIGGDISIGDVTGDGISDLAIGELSQPGTTAGKAYILFGSPTIGATPINLNGLDGTNGFIAAGTTSTFNLQSLSNADVNGDTISDLLFGTNAIPSNTKASTIYGKPPLDRLPPSPSATTDTPLSLGGSGTLKLMSTVNGSSTATNTTGSALAIDNSSSIGAALLNDGNGTITNLLIADNGILEISSNTNRQVTSVSNTGDVEAVGNLISSGILNIIPAGSGTTNSDLPNLNIRGEAGVVANETTASSTVSSRTVSGNAVATTGSVYGPGPTAQSPANALSPLGAAILGIREVAINAPSAGSGSTPVLRSSAQGILMTDANTIRGDALASSVSTAGALMGTGASTVETNGDVNAVASLTNRVIAQSISGNSVSSSFANSSGIDSYQILISGNGGINAQTFSESSAAAI